MASDKVILEYGSGRGLAQLFENIIKPSLLPEFNGVFEDAALIDFQGKRLAFTTDSFVVTPLEFPGGDIGKLAACGTINDLAMIGATPKWMAVSLILEEGLQIDLLRKVLMSLRSVCDECNVTISCGDTKVVERGSGNGIFITTSGIGVMDLAVTLSAANARENDAVIVSGPIASHGIAVLAARKHFGFASNVVSDCAALDRAARLLLGAAPHTRVMRDATRGGCAAVLNEIAVASGVTIRLKKTLIPVIPQVNAACSFLGFDPLQVANEGTFVAVVPQTELDAALKSLQNIAQCKDACQIGIVEKKGRFPVIIETEIGGTCPIEIPSGILLPRIC